jgi:hypothetical protein
VLDAKIGFSVILYVLKDGTRWILCRDCIFIRDFYESLLCTLVVCGRILREEYLKALRRSAERGEFIESIVRRQRPKHSHEGNQVSTNRNGDECDDALRLGPV